MTGQMQNTLIEQLKKEIEVLKYRLKREKELAEQANMELVQMTIEAERKARELEELNRKIKKHFLETIQIIENIIELKNPGYKNHAKRVSDGCRFLGEKLQLSDDEIQNLCISGRIHEIGKLGIPESVLKKAPSELTEADINILHAYPVLGESIFANLEEFHEVAKNIRHMRENVDGSGYPDRLAGDEIPLGSRILAICEAFDTLYYRRGGAVPPEKIYEIIVKKGNSAFDARLVDLYEDFVITYYAGKKLDHIETVTVEQLQEGMILAKNLRTLSNVMIAPKDTRLTTEIIQKIRKFATHEPIPHIDVYKQ